MRELAALGYKSSTPDTLVRMRIHGATPGAIRGFQQAGLGTPTTRRLVRLRIHNVTPEFIAGLKSRNYTGLDADDYTRMRIHGVTLDEIDALAAAGTARPGRRRPGAVPHPRGAARVHPRDARRWASPAPTKTTS